MDQRHEDLPTLPEDANFEPMEEVEGDTYATPTTNVSQWRLLKLIADNDGGIALSDIVRKFNLEDPQDVRIQFGLGQLVRAGRVKIVMGGSRVTGRVGLMYIATDKLEKKEEE